MYNNSIDQYISTVLSQIKCLRGKKVARKILYAEISELGINDHSEEQIASYLHQKFGDPSILGSYFDWLDNIADLH